MSEAVGVRPNVADETLAPVRGSHRLVGEVELATPSFHLTGQVALVTGANRGIGRRLGSLLVLTDAIRRGGGQASSTQIDVRDLASIVAGAEETLATTARSTFSSITPASVLTATPSP